jgi:hypothetical protein
MNPFSVLMFLFAGGLFLYGAILQSGDFDLIYKNYRVKAPKNKKAYTKAFGKVIALVGLAPCLSGIVALFGEEDRMALPAMAVLIAGSIAAIVIGSGWMKDFS